MNLDAIDVTDRPPLGHPEAMSLQAVELDRFLDVLDGLDAESWGTRTACPDWDVRQMALHVLGACEAAVSMRENLHQMRAARAWRRRHGGPLEAGLSGVQVRDRIDLSPEELVERLRQVAPATVRKRTKMPALMRRAKLKIDGPVVETWRLGYLVDTIYLRDLWMHRVDITDVTGRELVLTADHDGRIVADVVAEWARRHGRPFSLTLTGSAGGTFSSTGSDGSSGDAPHVELDAVEFCRTLAGRSEGTGLLATFVPF